MTNYCKKIAVIASAILVALSVAAGISDLPIKTVNGKRYHYYEVKSQETVYSLCRRFDISRDELIKYNPVVAEGLKAGQILYFPADQSSAPKTTTSALSTYMVQKDDTSYGISRRFDMTLEEFYSLNPSAKDCLKAGQTVKVKTNNHNNTTQSPDHSISSSVKSEPSSSYATSTYVIKAGETLYRIAAEHNTTVDNLLHLNPQLSADRYEAGMEIQVPVSSPGANRPSSPSTTSPASTNAVTDNVKTQPITPVDDSRLTIATDTCVIAIVLPFSGEEKHSKRAIEFYRGYVLAVDSLRSQGNPVKVMAFDTKGTEQGAIDVTKNTKLKQANIIIAPTAAQQMAPIAKFAKDHDIYLLNLFVIKDETYKTDSHMMNGNIPSMNEKAIDYYLTTYPDVTPVFIKRKGGATDQDAFVNAMKAALSERKVKYHEIEYANKLSVDVLNKLPSGKQYAFIPNTADIKELQKYIDAVVDYRNANLQTSPSLWGYPKWLTVRGGDLTKLHNANTLLFSRFSAYEKNIAEDELQNKFSHWYGTRIVDEIPRQGTYGFDTGMFMIQAIAYNNGDFTRFTPSYEGIQNAFGFEAIPGGGFVNNLMFMINFAPGDFTNRIRI